MYLIGSGALFQRWQSGLWGRSNSPKDWDYLATQADADSFLRNKEIILKFSTKFGFAVHINGSKPIEFEITDNSLSTSKLNELLEEHKDYDVIDNVKVVKPSVLLMLKMSHRFLRNSPHFNKTMDDILWLKNNGIVMPDYSTEWLKIRNKETYDYSHPSLKVNKNEFFTDNFYVWDHDSIHEAVKLGDRPAFESIKEDKAEVNCSKAKFFEQSESVRLATVYEETAVLALERHQIPNDFQPDPRKSFLFALKKVCTSITSGWWRSYAWDNYHKVIALYESLGETKYVEDLKRAEANGVLIAYSTPMAA